MEQMALTSFQEVCARHAAKRATMGLSVLPQDYFFMEGTMDLLRGCMGMIAATQQLPTAAPLAASQPTMAAAPSPTTTAPAPSNGPPAQAPNAPAEWPAVAMAADGRLKVRESGNVK